MLLRRDIELRKLVIVLLNSGRVCISPEDNLIIYGNGKVTHECIDNVHFIDKKEITINENAVLSIIDESKESSFFY